LGKDKCLDKLLELGRFIGGFTDDLNNDVVVGCLGIDVRNADLAVLEIEFFDTLLDSLYLFRSKSWSEELADLHFDRRKLELPQPQDQKRTGSASHKRATSIVSTSRFL
jgi:hypothetical protein